jgi:hypothetical protein
VIYYLEKGESIFAVACTSAGKIRLNSKNRLNFKNGFNFKN